MLKVGGFNELKPEQKIIEEKIFEIVKKNYWKYGYTPIETPAVERTEVLTAKWGWEVSKQIFGVYGLAQWWSDLKDYSLHFDLTVPFARYVLDYRNELTFPFKRSQIQKVWRGERQQRGRSREFYQADIDVIWEENNSPILGNERGRWKNLFYDAEVVSIWYKTYKEISEYFDLWLDFKININNKKIIFGFIKVLWLEEKFQEISIIIDKKDKISLEQFRQDLEKIVEMFGKNIWKELYPNKLIKGERIENDLVQKIIDFTNFEANYENLEEILKLVETKDFLSLQKSQQLSIQELQQWISELKTVLENIYLLWIPKENIVINLGIIRGLEYYTWTIFETFIDGDRKLWSIASGWRYEWLTKYLDKKSNFSWVGFSMWITRFEEYLFEKLQSRDKKVFVSTTSEYLVINFEETKKESLELFQKLAGEWKKIEFYPEAEKLKKQFSYADKKWIQYCVILWSWELEKWMYQIKDMRNGESEEINF